MADTQEEILPTVLDSTQIVCFRTCPQKFYNEFVCGLRRPITKIDLHAGSVFAKVLEDFQKNVHLKKLTPVEARAAALNQFTTEWGEIEAPSDSPKSMDRMWEAFEDYVRTYPPHTDHVQPYFVDGFPTFEFTFAIPLVEEWGFPLHPVTRSPFVYAGRFDMLGQWAGRPVIRDEKTTKYMGPGWSEQWDLRSQFIGYTWAVRELGLDLDTVVIRGIAIQKTQIKQGEAIKMYDEALRTRWFRQLKRDVHKIVECWESHYWDFNLGDSCNQYGRCQFTNMCASAHREAWASEFTVRRWNPLNHSAATGSYGEENV
jgi:hypothetical protein